MKGEGEGEGEEEGEGEGEGEEEVWRGRGVERGGREDKREGSWERERDGVAREIEGEGEA